jgi:hypothetical protein
VLKDIGQAPIIEASYDAKEEKKIDKPKEPINREPAGQLSLVSAINTN